MDRRFFNYLLIGLLVILALNARSPQSAAALGHRETAPGIVLYSAPVWTSAGNETGGEYAYDVALDGDFNNDGYSDLMIGSPRNSVAVDREGIVEVFYGGPSGPSASYGWRYAGGVKAASFGASVASAGDVNGDGYDDAVIGAYRFENADETPSEGALYLFYGSAAGLSDCPDWMVDGGGKDSRLGYAVQSAGDVNGDGYADVIAGAPWHLHAFDNEGAAYVYYGSAEGLSASPDWVTYGGQIAASYGTDISGVGDVNGDGFDDVLVGAPGYEADNEQTGAAFLFYGSEDGLDLTAAEILLLETPDARFGEAVSGAGDVNGDGYADIVIGAPGYSTIDGLSVGAVLIYFGSEEGLADVADIQKTGDQEFAFLGNAVGSAGDANQDDFDDVVFASYSYTDDQPDEGIVFVGLGSASAFQMPLGWSATGDKAEASFGFSVSAAGDVNGDGWVDLVVGAPYYRLQDTILGRAFLYLGCADCAPTAQHVYLPLITTK